MKHCLLVLLLLLLAAALPLDAQPALNLKRVVSINWPRIELHCSVDCNGSPGYPYGDRYFRVLEDGKDMPFTSWSPDPTWDPCPEASLVFDASGDMGGPGNAFARVFGNVYVDDFGRGDYASVLWFNDSVTIRQGMTDDMPLLHAAVDALPANGRTALWDGVSQDLQEIINKSFCVPAAVIVVANGDDTATGACTAPLDTSTFTTLRLGLGSAFAEEDEDVSVPLLLLDSVASTLTLPSAEFFVGYDPSQLTFQRIEAPPESPLRGVPITTTGVMDGIVVRTRAEAVLQPRAGPLVLATLTFRAGSRHGADSLVTPLALASWRFSSGCIRPVLSGGAVTITQSTPDLHCSVQAPDALVWDAAAKNYAPNPFPLTATVTNAGQLRFTSTFVTLTHKESDVMRLSPATPFAFGVPDTMPPQGSSRTEWLLHAMPRDSADTVTIFVNIEALVGSVKRAFTRCPVRVFVPKAAPAITCTLAVDSVSVDPFQQKLDPMPFRVKAWLRNAGSGPLDSVRAAIVLPPGLALGWPDAAGDTVKRADSVRMQSLDVWTATWYVAAPPAERDSTYRIRVIARGAPADPDERTVDVTLPGLGTLRPRLALARDTLDCGSAVPGGASVGVLSFSNTGAVDLHLSGVTITGPDSSRFSLTRPFPATLSAGENSARSVQFSPVAYGARSATLRFTTDDPDRPSVSVALVGRGVGAARLAVDTLVDFGTVRDGDARDTALAVSNTGSGELKLLAQSIGGANASQFRIIWPAATPIAPGATSYLTLRFQPSGSGPRTASLMLGSNDAAQPLRMIALKGNAGIVGVDDADAAPRAPLLAANRPNPFAASTLLSFSLPAEMQVRLSVCDALGREVALLLHGAARAGTTSLRFDASLLPDGLYFAVLRAGGRQCTLPMLKAGRK